MFALVQIRHLLGSAFGSVSHRPLDAFSTGNAQSIANQREASLLSPKNLRVGDTEDALKRTTRMFECGRYSVGPEK